ncbi:MAG: hypothetical protein NTW19_17780 [Planctomycetota bacterium]|nr:hypothetical protein [Planctomycetota bacterium]
MAKKSKKNKKRGQYLKAASLGLAAASMAMGQGTPAQAAPPATAPSAATPPPAAPKPPAPAPAAAPATPAAPAPAHAAAPATAPAPTNIRFQFDGMPYPDVIRLFAQMANKPLIGDAQIEGTLTFFDPEPYNFNDAFDTLNTILAMRGFALIDTGRFFEVAPLNGIAKRQLRIMNGLDQVKDVPKGEIVTVVLPLKFVAPDTATRTLAPMVSSFGTIAPLARGKGVIITDRLNNIQRIRTLLNEIDAENLVDQQIRTIKLKSASARQVADIVNNLFVAVARNKGQVIPREGGGDPIRIEGVASVNATCDERTNTLILVGSGDQITMAEQMVHSLDAGQEGDEPLSGAVRIFELKSGARAEDLAATLKNALPPAVAPAPGPGRRATPVMETRIVADAATNRLVVSAPADQMNNIEALIKQLDQATVEAGGLRVFHLTTADAQQLAGVLVQAVTDRDPRGKMIPKIDVHADPRTNTVIVSGPAGDIQRAATLIEELDHPLDKETREIHVVQLKGGDANQLAASLGRLFNQQGGRDPKAGTTLRVEPDVTTNSLMISAAPGDWPLIQNILSQLKSDAVPMSTPSTRLVPLKSAKASEIAPALQMVFNNQNRAAVKGAVPVVITASDRANSLLVSAAADDQETIAMMLKSLDVPSTEKVDPVRIIRLKSADAVRLADSLRAMAPSQPNAPVFIQADPLTNSVLVRAGEAQQKMLEEMIGKLDLATQEDARETRIIDLKHASASALAPMLLQIFPPTPAGQPRKPGSPAEMPVVISVAPGDRALVIDAPRARIQQITQLVSTLDVGEAPGQMQVRSYQLAVAQAGEVAPTLARLFATQANRPGAQAQNQPQPRFEANGATNQLIIGATNAQFEEIEPLIKKLEAASTLASQTRTFTLKHALSSDVVPVLQSMLIDQPVPGRPPRPEPPARVAGIAGSNTIVVSGPPDKLALAEQLVKTFDQSETAGHASVQIVQLKSAQAATLAQAVNASLAEQRQPPRPGERAPEPMFVTPEPNSNSVLVRGPGERIDSVVEMIKKLDAQSSSAESQTRTFTLHSAKASDVAPVLQAVLGQPSGRPPAPGARPEVPTQVAALPAGNTLVIQGPSDKLALAEQLIKTFDRPEVAMTSAIQIVQLKNAQADTLAASLNATLSQGKPAPRPGAKPGEDLDRVTVTPEPNSNSLLIKGPADQVPDVVNMIKKLDEQSTSAASQVRVFPLAHSQAPELAGSLAKLFHDLTSQAAATRKGPPAPFTVAADARTNSLVVSTTPAHFALVEQLLASLDKASDHAGADVQYVTLRNATASEVASRVNAVFKARPANDKPVVEPDDVDNSLTIVAKPADAIDIQAIITKLDEAAKDNTRYVRVIPLTQVRADALAEVLKTVYAQVSGNQVVVQSVGPAAPEAGKEGGSTKLSPALLNTSSIVVWAEALAAAPDNKKPADAAHPPVSIGVDKSANALIISATKQDLDNIEALIKKLSLSSGRGDAEFRLFKIEHADPDSIATTLDDLYNAKVPAIPPGVDPNKVLGPLPPPQISVVTDGPTRSLIVRAKPTEFQTIEALVRQLDQPGVAPSEIKIFNLKNTDAADVATNLKDLFTAAATAAPGQPAAAANAQGRRAQRLRTAVAAVAGVPKASSKADAAKAVTITANRQTNSVVVAAPPEVMEIVGQIVQELDQSAALSGLASVRMYPVQHADVPSVVASLQQLFGPGAQVSRGPSGGGGAGAVSPPVVIAGDNAGRTVIVSAPANKHELIAKVIADIDAAQGKDPTVVKVYAVQFADASSLAAAITNTIAAPVGAPGGGRGQSANIGIRVSADPSSNSLIVRASQDDHVRLAAMIEQLDAAPVTQLPVQTIQLKNADPLVVAQALSRIFGPAGGVRGAAARPAALIEADRSAKLLMVRTDEKTFARIKDMAAQLDAGTPSGTAITAVFSIKNAAAPAVANAVSQAFAVPRGRTPAPEDQVTAVAEPQSNSVVVNATEANMARVRTLIEKLDGDAALGTKTESLAVKNARVADLANVLARAGIGGAPGKGGINISPDVASNTLVLSGPADAVAKTLELAKLLDAATPAGAPAPMVIPLKSANAAYVAQAVNQLFAAPRGVTPAPDQMVTAVAEPFSNSVIVTASAAKQPQIKELAEKLDVEAAAGSKTESLVLKNSRAVDVVNVLRGVAPPATPGKPGLAITADHPSNTLILTGPADGVAKLAALAKQIDEGTPAGGSAPTVFALKNAQAPWVAQAIAQSFAATRGVAVTPDQVVTAVAEPFSNSVIVTASAPNIEKIKGLVAKLDAEASAGLKTESVVLKNGRAVDIVNVLRGVAQPNTPGKPGVSLTADHPSNTIVLSGPAESVAKLVELAKQLDAGTPEGGNAPTVFALKNAQAPWVAQAIAQSFSAPRGVALTSDQVVTAVAEPYSNSVIVTASAQNLEKIKGLVAKLDAEASAGLKTESIVMKNGRAIDLANVLRGVAQPTTPGKPGVSITADHPSNTLVLSGPSDGVTKLAELAKQLDAGTPAGGGAPSVFPLKNAQAPWVAQAIAQSFAAPRGVAVTPDQVVTAVAEPYSNSVIVTASAQNLEKIKDLVGKLDAEASAGLKTESIVMKNARAIDLANVLRNIAQPTTPGKPGVSITADMASNTLLLSGPADGVVKLAELAKQLDTGTPAGGNAPSVFTLKNAQAPSIAQAINQSFAAPRGMAVTPDQVVTAVAEPVSNSVVVTASGANLPKIQALVEKLDAEASTGNKTESLALKNSRAVDVANVLRSLAPQTGAGKSAVIIAADAGSNTLLMSGPPEPLAKTLEIAKHLEATTPAGAPAPVLIALKNAQAFAVSLVVNAAFAPPRGVNPSPDQVVSVVPETLSNSLVVTASPLNLPKVQELVQKLDAEGSAGAKPEMLVLKNARAVDMVGVLYRVSSASSRAGAIPVSITADGPSNALVLSGPPADVARVKQMATDLDAISTDAAPSVFILPLKNGDAVAVTAMVRDLYTQQTQAARSSGKSVEPLAVSADERANALVVASSKSVYEQVSQWVNKVEEMKPARGSLKIITLQSADPTEVDKAIKELFGPRGGTGQPAGGAAPAGGGQRNTRPGGGNRPGGAGAPAPGGGLGGGTGGGGGGSVQTSLLPQQRSILIDASDDDFAAVLKLTEALDAAAAAAKRQVRVFQLKKANNARVADALTIMYRPVAGRPGAVDESVSVNALPQTDAVVVSASPKVMEDVAHLIEELDKAEVAGSLEFRIFALKNTSPGKILPALTPLIAQLQRTRPADPISVQGDERTRSIIVTARGPLFEQAQKIIEGLDQPAAFAQADVLVIPLRKADSTRLAAVLNEMLRPDAAGNVTPEARALQEQLRMLRLRGAEDGQLHELTELDLTKPIRIVADSAQQGSNALVVTSTPENLKAVRAIVSVLDTVPLADGVKVRLVHLKNADAQSVLTVITQIFNDGQKLAGKTGTPAAGKAVPDSLAGKALVSPLNVSVDGRTNTLVIAGVEESLALADLVINDLDRTTGEIVTEVRLFKLAHADAAKTAPMLTAVFAEAPSAVAGVEGIRTQITRLRTVLEKGAGTVSQVPKTRPPLTIQADASTQTLIVAARADVMPLIADVVKTMDVPGVGGVNTVRIVPLVNADPTRLKQVVDSLYAGQAASQLKPEDKPTIAVDSRTNALVITASDKTYAVLEAMIKQLDAKMTVDLKDIRLVTLKNAEALSLAKTLQSMMDARLQRQTAVGGKDLDALKVAVMADPRSNSLLVGGSAEGFELVKSLAEQLDSAKTALSGQVTLMPLMHANAGTLAATLSRLFDQRYSNAGAAANPAQKPLILPDLRTNSLMVAANADDRKVLEGLLEKLDVTLTDASVAIEVITLKHNDAATVAPNIRTIFQARMTTMATPGVPPAPQDHVDVAFDPLTNSLIITASKENLALVHGLLDKVDIEPPSESGVVRMYALKNSDAQRVSTLLQGLIAQGLYTPGAAAATGNAAATAREKVAVAVDLRTNVLIVSASKENFAVIEEIIKGIDNTQDFALSGDVRIFALNRADATRLAPTLQQFFNAKRAGEQATGGAGRSLPVTIIPDSRTNALLVAGSRESFAAIEGMVKKLDGEQALPLNEFRVFLLKNASATGLQPTVQQLFDQRALRDDVGPKRKVTVVADARTNGLVVGANAEDLEIADALVKRLDVEPDSPGNKVGVFPLSRADALSVAATLRSIYQAQLANPGAPGQPANPNGLNGSIQTSTLSITADVRLNAIVVSAQQTDMDRVAELVRQLDGDQGNRVTEIRVFALHNADATELSGTLTTAIKGQLGGGGSGGGAAAAANGPALQTVLQFITRSQDGQSVISSQLQQGILITPDKRTNSVVVSAPVENMELLDSLIKAMDTTSAQAAEIHVFRLMNADARQMADMLSQLFKLQGGGGANQRIFSYQLVQDAAATQPSGAAPPPAPAADPGPGKTADSVMIPTAQSAPLPATQPSAGAVVMGTADQQALSITVDARTNSLLICGTHRHVMLCSDVIRELDSSPAQERQTQLYRLKNAQSVDIQTALRAFLDQERQRVVSALGNDKIGAAQRLLEREVAVVAEKTTNTLLLSASPRYFQTIAAMVRELDQPQPQVLIQCMLAEVTLDDNTAVGFEWSVTKKLGDYNMKTGTALGVANQLASTGGFSVSVTGSDLSMLLRALQTQGKVEVLSRPQLLAADNQEAEINVGQRVPIIDNSRVSGDNNPVIINTIHYENIGILLKVTARINHDGFVRMDVAPTVSSLSSDTVPVSTGFNATIINNRSAKTSVSVQDGHTIILGGLITNKDESHETKVPLLGDVPLLGNLFKNRTTTKQRTELLIILTPHVIQTVPESDRLSTEAVTGFNSLRIDSPKQFKEVLGKKVPLPVSVETRDSAATQPGGAYTGSNSATQPMPTRPGPGPAIILPSLPADGDVVP